MKLISLNAWGGNQGVIFFDYLNSHKDSTDIFCFQEVLSASLPSPTISSGARAYFFQELEERLPEFKGYFCLRTTNSDLDGPKNYPVNQGLAIFFKQKFSIESYFENVVAEIDFNQDHPSEGKFMAQGLVLNFNNKQLGVVNYHGMSRPGDKQDTERRILASGVLKKVWQNVRLENKILCGDFNLLPNTQSIQILESVARNLISEFKIQNTRNEISWQKYKNKQSFADYMFVSNSINVQNFQVPYNLVSDHLPMELEFNI
jgi:hypothetical protein